MHVRVEEAIDDVNVAAVFAVMEVQVGGRDEDGHRHLLESMEAWQGVDAAGAIGDVEAQHAVPAVGKGDLGLRGGGQEMNGVMVPHGVGELRCPYGQLDFWRNDLGRGRLRRRQILVVADPSSFPVGGTCLGGRQRWQHLAMPMRGRLLCRRVKKFHLGEIQALQQIHAFVPVIQP